MSIDDEAQFPDFGRSSSGDENPIPRFGLGGAFSGKRWIEGEGWDVCTVVHRSDTGSPGVTVGVLRRATARPAACGPRVAISKDLARQSIATVLVADLPGIGSDVFDVAAEVAREEQAWAPRDVVIDGAMVSGYEREYDGAWVAYCLTATLIIYVLAPATIRLKRVELRTLGPNEVASLSTRTDDNSGPHELP